jgi:hypothetical protein
MSEWSPPSVHDHYRSGALGLSERTYLKSVSPQPFDESDDAPLVLKHSDAEEEVEGEMESESDGETEDEFEDAHEGNNP